MTRDQKIGFALGILLVGAVAAFFYRHEEPTGVPLPELRSAEELDRQISERPLAPYREPRTEKQSALEPTIDREPFPDSEAGGLVPEPIALEGTGISGPTTRLASSSNSVNGDGRPSSNSAPATSIPRTHVVQRGDTLSSIAYQYLGSATRFEEIYAANRDRLRDANDLRIGQQLTIPSAAARPSTLPARNPVTPAQSSPVPEPAGREPAASPSKFVPYPGPRGVPARTAMPADSATPSGNGRRLSQIPPDDTVIRR